MLGVARCARRKLIASLTLARVNNDTYAVVIAREKKDATETQRTFVALFDFRVGHGSRRTR